MHKNLIISGGIFHHFEESSSALVTILHEVDVESNVTHDVDAGIQALAGGRYEMLTINALRWGMMTADKYEPYRGEWAYRMPQSTRDALQEFVESGGALLGIHTASICFDDWPEWGTVLGGQWQWGISYHPPLGPVSVRPTENPHAVTKDIRPFEFIDEIYHDLKLQGDVVPLLEGESAAGNGPQPIVWARKYGKGRVVYDALGHDAASVKQPQHQQLLQQATRWLLADA